MLKWVYFSFWEMIYGCLILTTRKYFVFVFILPVCKFYWYQIKARDGTDIQIDWIYIWIIGCFVGKFWCKKCLIFFSFLKTSVFCISILASLSDQTRYPVSDSLDRRKSGPSLGWVPLSPPGSWHDEERRDSISNTNLKQGNVTRRSNSELSPSSDFPISKRI